MSLYFSYKFTLTKSSVADIKLYEQVLFQMRFYSTVNIGEGSTYSAGD